MTGNRQHRAARSAGFTLLELLLVLSLTAFLMVILTGGLALGGRVWERFGTASDEAAGRAAGLSALRGLLENIRPLPYTAPDGRWLIAFDGEEDRLAFASDLGPVSPAPGVRKFDLVLDHEAGGLILAARSGQTTNRTLLLEGVSAVEFSYLGTEEWQPDWTGEGRLPRLIRVSLRYEESHQGSGQDSLHIAPRLAGPGAADWAGTDRIRGSRAEGIRP